MGMDDDFKQYLKEYHRQMAQTSFDIPRTRDLSKNKKISPKDTNTSKSTSLLEALQRVTKSTIEPVPDNTAPVNTNGFNSFTGLPQADTESMDQGPFAKLLNQPMKQTTPLQPPMTPSIPGISDQVPESVLEFSEKLKKMKESGMVRSEPPQEYRDPNACRECGLIHPPLKPGEKCPCVTPEIVTKTDNDQSQDAKALTIEQINKKLTEMRNIIISQIEARGVKDPEKFFNYAIVELTKALERYSEKKEEPERRD